MHEASRWLSEKIQNFVIKLQKSLADKGSIFEHNIPWSYAILIMKRTSHSFITTNSRGTHNWTKELANLKKNNNNKDRKNLNPLKQNIKIQQLKSF